MKSLLDDLEKKKKKMLRKAPPPTLLPLCVCSVFSALLYFFFSHPGNRGGHQGSGMKEGEKTVTRKQN